MFLCTSLGILLGFTGLQRDWSSLLLTCLASVSIFTDWLKFSGTLGVFILERIVSSRKGRKKPVSNLVETSLMF